MPSSTTPSLVTSQKSKGGFLRWMSMTAMVGAVLMGTARHSDAADVTVDTTADVVDAPDLSSITTLQGDPGLDGKISLREAVIAANNTPGANSIDFAILAGTITLTGGELTLTDTTTITGPGAANLTIDGGNTTRIFSAPSYYRSGVYVGYPVYTYYPGGYEQRPITISGVTLSGGNTGGGGGAMSVGPYRQATIDNCIITGCHSGGSGGAFYAGRYSGLYINNSTLSGNSADSVGGAILAYYSTQLTLNNSTITSSTSAGSGGGIYARNGSTVNVSYSTIDNNTAGNYGYYGGGIFIGSYATLLIEQSTISSNSSRNTGGGIFTRSGATINNSTIANNSSPSYAGLDCPNGVVTLSSSIASGNIANSTFGADVFQHSGSSLNLKVNNSLVTYIAIASQGSNAILFQPARLTPLLNLGGPTRTHGLLSGSPALNTGLQNGFSYDQRGNPFPRVVGGTADMGALEGVVTVPVVSKVVAPTVTVSSNPTQYDITLTFEDDTGVDVSSIINNNSLIRVTGPGGFNQLATYVSIDVNSNGTPRVAVFRITPAGGTWDATDNGTYSIAVEPNQLKDISANFGPAGVVGNFTVAVGSTFVVTNLNDSGAGSLRDALFQANTNGNAPLVDDVTFQAGLTGTINLTSGHLYAYESVAITGPGASVITVSGAALGNSAVLYARYYRESVDVSGLTISGGGNSGIRAGNGANLTLGNVIMSGNRSNGDGGALFLYNNSTVTVNNSVFSGNAAGSDGGAIAIEDAYLTMDRCTLTGNSSSGSGGAIYLYDSGGLITNTTVSANRSGREGGGIYLYGTTVEIRGSTISGNVASGGGGIYLYDSTVYLTNSTVAYNRASRGGGIYLYDSIAHVSNSTIAKNTASVFGGGVLLYEGSRLYMSSTIVSGNTAPRGNDLYNRYDNNTVGAYYSLIQDPNFGAGVDFYSNCIFAQDPMLRPLANNGGPTLTMSLRAGSPALDAGYNVLALTTDQRGTGFPRVLNGTADIGAVEGVTPIPLVFLSSAPTVSGSSNPTQYDFTITIDDDTGVDVSSLGNSNLLVTGPNGFSQSATFVSVDVNTNGTPRVATFRITPPGGTWDIGDNGVYTVSVQANQIKDIDGNFAFASQIGQFSVGIGVTFIVKNLNDSGLYSLRDCVQKANSNGNPGAIDTITFQSGLTGTITLTSGMLRAYESVSIVGPGAAVISVDGNANERILYTYGIDVGISGLTVTNGSDNSDDGAGVKTVDSTITIADMVFTRNNAGSDSALAMKNSTGTVRNSTFSYNYASDSGGGAWLYDGSNVTFDTCIFTKNSAGRGGGIYMYEGSTLVLKNCTFDGNIALSSGSGGALYATDSSTVTISNTTFSTNSSGGQGGAVFLKDNSHATISGCTFSKNTAGTEGGALSARDYSQFAISDCVISENIASSGGGGGISIEDNSGLSVSNTTFDKNMATAGWGGGLYLGSVYNATANTIQRCTFSNNTAATDSGGGAIEIYQTQVVIENSTFNNNSAGDNGGGALYVGSSTATVRNCTIAGNVADSGGLGSAYGGGLRGGTSGTVTLISTIIAGNQRGAVGARVSDDVSDPNNDVDPASDHNLIGDGTGQTALVNGANGNQVGAAGALIDPKLGALANNGGPTQTMLLQGGSPAIDAGSNPATLTVDQRGLARVLGTSIDIGAVEFDPQPPTAAPGSAPDVGLGSVLDDYTFTIVYTDNQGMLPSTMDGNDILVTGPNGFSQLAQFVSLDVNTAGSPRVATYRIIPPGGTWDAADNGTYAINMVAGQVTDAQGNPVAAGVIGTFQVNVGAGLGPLDPDGDIDGDGFTNGWETALGSDPRDPNSRPFSLPRPATGGIMKVRQMLVALDFSGSNRDRIKVTGLLPIKDTRFALAGQIVILDVGGVVKAFTLGADGTAVSGNDKIRVKLGRKKNGQFVAEFTNGDFAKSFVDEGLVPAAAKGPKLVRATILLNNLYYQAIVKRPFNVKKGKFGH